MTEIQLAACLGCAVGILLGAAFVVWLVARNVGDEGEV